ncbi:Hypothetical protein NTJ_07659 [Nesidiocoris tenuis]|uniref:Uncharacterized protein n=1 Tax=Nesidiocoris tenuis TaxID=355587 RepID=A0ABN7ARK9_9HEMI|nr:Hypothetical protein NTJ_07659 [Nesidiocoris tenuis]
MKLLMVVNSFQAVRTSLYAVRGPRPLECIQPASVPLLRQQSARFLRAIVVPSFPESLALATWTLIDPPLRPISHEDVRILLQPRTYSSVVGTTRGAGPVPGPSRFG